MRVAAMAFKGIIFLVALYLWGAIFPCVLYFGGMISGLSANLLGGLPGGFSFWLLRGTLLLAFVAWITFFLRSVFFLRIRQWLKPVWLPAAFAWLIPVVALMVVSSARGSRWYGFPIPSNVGAFEEPWPALLGQLLPQMAIMLCVIVFAFIIGGAVKRRRAKIVRRLGVLAVFSALCVWSSSQAIEYFLFSPNIPWNDAEKFRYMFLPYAHYLAFWLGISLIAAWRVTGELLGASEEKNSHSYLPQASPTGVHDG